MTALDDDLLAALRAARPGAGGEPSATSTEATAMLTRIMRTPRAPVPRRTRRRLLLAGIPATAGAAAAVTLAVALIASGTAPGPGRHLPTVSSVRAAMLDAFSRYRGDIFAETTTQTIGPGGKPGFTFRRWSYPAFPVPGQRVRYRQLKLDHGKPSEDTEFIFVLAAPSRPSMKTPPGPRTTVITDVKYATRTWSRQRNRQGLLGGGLSPSLIRDLIASGHFTVTGRGRVRGRPAIELTWSSSSAHSPTPRRIRITETDTLWVDARSYVPLRDTTVWARQQGREVVLRSNTEYRLLPATPANLGLLTAPIPRGFTRTAGSPNL